MMDDSQAVKNQTASAPATDDNPVSTDRTAEPDLHDQTRSRSTSEQSGAGQYIPYARFKEVIDERNRLRQCVAEHEQAEHIPDDNPLEISETEMNYLWDENPSQAARIMFDSILDEKQNRRRQCDMHLAKTIERYPELADTNSEILKTARTIVHDEMPHLKHDPRGLAIAAELAVARHSRTRTRHDDLSDPSSLTRRQLEATRAANLKQVRNPGQTPPLTPRYYDSLSSDEQDVARKMGVPIEEYCKHKRHNQGEIR